MLIWAPFRLFSLSFVIFRAGHGGEAIGEIGLVPLPSSSLSHAPDYQVASWPYFQISIPGSMNHLAHRQHGAYKPPAAFTPNFRPLNND